MRHTHQAPPGKHELTHFFRRSLQNHSLFCTPKPQVLRGNGPGLAKLSGAARCAGSFWDKKDKVEAELSPAPDACWDRVSMSL